MRKKQSLAAAVILTCSISILSSPAGATGSPAGNKAVVPAVPLTRRPAFQKPFMPRHRTRLALKRSASPAHKLPATIPNSSRPPTAAPAPTFAERGWVFGHGLKMIGRIALHRRIPLREKGKLIKYTWYDAMGWRDVLTPAWGHPVIGKHGNKDLFGRLGDGFRHRGMPYDGPSNRMEISADGAKIAPWTAKEIAALKKRPWKHPIEYKAP